MKTESDLQKVMEEKFLTPNKFSMAIEKIVFEEKVNYIEAIVQYCESNNIEIEIISKLITKPLKDIIKWDASRLNYIKKTPNKKK